MKKKLLKHTTPLCFLPNGNLIAYSKGNVIIIDKDDRIIKKIIFKEGGQNYCSLILNPFLDC